MVAKICNRVIPNGGLQHMNAVRVSNVKRNLFGGKVDSEKLKQLVEEQLASENEEKRKKWSFDFKDGRPLESGSYQWKRVVPARPATQSPPTAMVIPATRRLQRATSCEPLPMEELMDVRAERANRTDEEQHSDIAEPESTDRASTATDSTTTACKVMTPPPSPSCSSTTASGEKEPKTSVADYFKKCKRLSVRTQNKKVLSEATTTPPAAVSRPHSVPSTSSD
ncbi:uncharacterized protein LOC131214940 [Anopheles bellator]|uniref:uncharacterized protein LOC131214940 n=1 Tax=Anopheles bellator TaxID=139047 RepID=UPI00264913A7|nr:uncharacterized protein LOC131214940 [Anopheles bellator]